MSLSDFSELTDLDSSSDEDDIPLYRSTKKPVKKKGDYQVQNALRPPRTSQYSAKSLYDQIVENTIDLDPEYQREVVWPENKQVGLIDSILRNYYIPPIIFAVTTARDGGETRTCIDGKQRLTSIQRFMDGLIPHKDAFTNVKMWYKQNAGSTKRKLLPKALKQAFANKQIVCVEYDYLSNDQEREIFQRVQLGMPLTPAERMSAISSELATLVREIQTDVQTGFEGYLEWGRARGRDFQCITTIAYFVDKFPSKTWPGVLQLEGWLQKPDAVRRGFHDDIRNTFRTFLILVREKKFNIPFSKPTRVSPVEFVMIGVLIHVYRTKLSFMQLCSAIELLRADVRKKFDDIRGNTKVTKHMMEFISKKLKTMTLKGDGDDPPASRDRKYGGKQKTAKRKRTESSDDEYDEPPAKTSTSRGSSSKGATASSKLSSSSKQLPKPSATSSSSLKSAMKPPLAKQSGSAEGAKRSTQESSVTSSDAPATQPSSRSAPSPRIPKAPGPSSRPSTAATSPRPPAQRSATISTPVQKQPPSAPPPRPPSAPPSQRPVPNISNTESSSAPSVPPLSSMQPPPVSIKQEPQNFSLGGISALAPRTVPASALPDRLAPIRAAKAASSTPNQSPTVPNGGQALRIVTSNTSQVIQDPRKMVNNVSGQPQSAGPSTQSPLVPGQSPVITTPTFKGGAPIPPIDLEGILRRNGMSTQAPPTTPSAMAPPDPRAQFANGIFPIVAPHSSSSDMSISPEHSVRNGVNGPSSPSFLHKFQNLLHGQPASIVSNGIGGEPGPPGQEISVGIPIPSGPNGQTHDRDSNEPATHGANGRPLNGHQLPHLGPPPQAVNDQIPIPPTSASSSQSHAPPPDSASSYGSYRENRNYPNRQPSDSYESRWDRDRDSSRDYRDYSPPYSQSRYRDRGRGDWRDSYRSRPRSSSRGRYRKPDRGWS